MIQFKREGGERNVENIEEASKEKEGSKWEEEVKRKRWGKNEEEEEEMYRVGIEKNRVGETSGDRSFEQTLFALVFNYFEVKLIFYISSFG